MATFNLKSIGRLALSLAFALIFSDAAMIAADAPSASTTAAELKYEDKWRIKCNQGADNDGFAKFRITPLGAAPIDVVVTIKKGRSENGVASDVKYAFKEALKKKPFGVEGDDFEDVLVKKDWDGVKFSLQLIESTLKGTQFKIQKE